MGDAIGASRAFRLTRRGNDVWNEPRQASGADLTFATPPTVDAYGGRQIQSFTEIMNLLMVL